MSGSEVLAVIGIVANIIQLVDFSGKVISRIKEYSGDVHKVPKAFRETQTVLPLIAHALQETQRQVSSGQLAEAKCKALQPVLKECEAKLTELNVIFENALPEDGTSKTRRRWMALSSLRQDSKVEEISKALRRYLQILTYYHVVSAPTALEIASLTENASNVSLGAASATPAKTYFMVPSLPMTDFTGREETMVDLEAKLCLPDKYSRVALIGLGGIGKTRVALQLAHKHRKSTDKSVFWVYAHNAERMKTSYEDIARRAAIPGHQDPAVDVLKLVKDWFENVSPGKWLIIVDNADDSELLYSSSSQPVRYADYLPRSDQGSILLTTRNGRVGKSFTTPSSVITLRAMSIEESENLLSTHLDVKIENHSFEELAEQLGRIPLALVQAAAFMSHNSVSAEKYLQLYRQSDSNKIQLLSENFEDEVRHPLSQNPITTTWLITFEYIKEHDPQAVDLLSFMSTLADQAVLDTLLPPGDDPVAFEQSLGTLQNFSFISMRHLEFEQSQHRYLDYHRLVRLVMRNWLKISTSPNQWTAVTISRLSSLTNSGVFNNHKMWSQLIPHAIEILASDVLQGVPGPRDVPKTFLDRKLDRDCRHDGKICACCTANLLHRTAEGLHDVDSHAGARAHAQRAMVLRTHLLGAADESTLQSAKCLLHILRHSSEFDCAKALCWQVIETSKNEHGLENYYTLYFTVKLENLLRDYPDSEPDAAIRKELLEDYETGMSHIGVSEDLKLLSLASDFHYDTGHLDEAAEYGLRVVEGYTATSGLESYEAIRALLNLTNIKQRLRQFEESEELGRMSLEASNKYYGLDDPTTLECMSKLMKALWSRQKFAEANALATTLLKLTAEVFGETSRTYSRRSKWCFQNFASIELAKYREEVGWDGMSSRLTVGLLESMNQPKHCSQRKGFPVIVTSNPFGPSAFLARSTASKEALRRDWI